VKILAIHPGASFSTADVWDGLIPTLRAEGHEVKEYRLDERIDRMGHWLKWNWQRAGRVPPKPTSADIQYWASWPSLEMALRLEVDWVLILSGMFYHPDFFILLRRAGLKVACLLTECPYDDQWQQRLIPYLDLVFVNERTSVAAFREWNDHVYYLPHAYEPSRHHPEPSADEPTMPSHDVVFVGTGFMERIEVLSQVDWSGIDLGLYGVWDLLGSRHRLRRYVRSEPIANRQTVALYRRAKIGLNLHRTSVSYGRFVPRIERAESLNPRAYELAACGLFHLSDDRAELGEVFGDGVPRFADAASLEGQLRFYLDHPDERAEVAAELPALVARHTFAERAATVSAALRAYAPAREVVPV
jgi:spore maturation protein CgeB